MSTGIFTDKTHQPTAMEIEAALGDKQHLWQALRSFAEQQATPAADFRFYGRNYGWALRYRKGSKALLSLYPGERGLVAQIVLSVPQVEQALKLKLGRNTRQVLVNAKAFPEGCWLFVKAKSKRDVADIRRLLLLKSQSMPGRKQPSHTKLNLERAVS